MKGTDFAIFAARDQDRGVADRQILHQIIARLGNFFLSAYVEPDAPEDTFPLERKVFF